MCLSRGETSMVYLLIANSNATYVFSGPSYKDIPTENVSYLKKITILY